MIDSDSTVLLVAAERLSSSLDNNTIVDNEELTNVMERTVSLFKDFDLATNLPSQQYETTAETMNGLLDKVAIAITKIADKKGFNEFDIFTAVDCIPDALPRLYLSCIAIDLLLRRGSDLDWNNCVIGGPNELLKDFLDHCNAIRYPLKGIYMRSYAIHTLAPHLINRQMIGEEVASGFLCEMFGEMHKLWVRLGFQGPLSDLEQRQNSRKEMVNHILFPIRKLAEMFTLGKLSSTLYSEKICPALLEHIVSSADYYSQTLVFSGLLQEIPVSLHRETLNTLLEAVSCFSFKVSLKDTLKQLIDRIADERHQLSLEEELAQFDSLWDKISRILAGKLIKFERDSELVSVCSPLVNNLLKLQVNKESIKRLDTLLEFLCDNLSNLKSENFVNLMKEIIMECSRPEILLNSPAAMKLFRPFDLDILFLERLTECDHITETDSLMQVLGFLYNKESFVNHLPFIEDLLATTHSVLQKTNPIKAFEALLFWNMSDNYLMNCCIQQVVLSIPFGDRQELLPALEKEATKKTDLLGFEPFMELFAFDARAFQICCALLKTTDEAIQLKSEPLSYLYLTKSIQTLDQNITHNTLLSHALKLVLSSFKSAANTVLKKQDVEALIANLLRLSKRQLDASLKASSSISLLQISTQINVSIDILKDLLEVIIRSVTLVTCEVEKSRLGVDFFSLALLVFTNYPDIVVMYRDVNDFLWSLRDNVVQSHIGEYNQLWGQWLSVLPPSSIEPAAILKESSSLEIFDNEDETSTEVINAIHNISLTDEFR